MNKLITEILNCEGAATLVTESSAGAHVTATWNSYMEEGNADQLLIPAGGLEKTEQNIKSGSKLRMLIGSKQVRGKNGMGAGFRLTGTATFVVAGESFNKIKSRFPWARAVVVFTIEIAEQLI